MRHARREIPKKHAQRRSAPCPPTFAPAPFRRALLTWWKRHQRAFPWRETRDPFAVLVAEVLLHRTRALQVVPLYRALLDRAPSVRALAEMPLSELEALLRPAGLVWRVRLLHEMATALLDRFGDSVPHDRAALESLPGVGHYIASAVRVLAFGEPDVLQDANTVRIAGRVFGVPITDASRRSRKVRALLERIQHPQRSPDLQLALLDLGAIVCQAGRPRCEVCPVRRWCVVGSRA